MDRVSNLDKHISWFSREDVDFVYIPILRCGHNWAKSYLIENGFTEVDHDSASHKTRVVIIRDPLNRILSGMVAIGTFDYSVLDKNIHRLEEELRSDPHTCSMLKFLPNDGHTDYVYIKFGVDTDYMFRHFLSERGVILPEPPMEWQRQSGDSSKETKVKVLNDNHLTSTLQNYLKDDYEFYNNIKWYQS